MPVAVTESCVAVVGTPGSVKTPSATVVKLTPPALTTAPLTGVSPVAVRMTPFTVVVGPPPPPPPHAARAVIVAAATSASSIRLDRFIPIASWSSAHDRERLYRPHRIAFRRARRDVEDVDARRHRCAALIARIPQDGVAARRGSATRVDPADQPSIGPAYLRAH